MWPVVKRFIFDASFALAVLGSVLASTLGEVVNPPVWLRVSSVVVILAAGLYKAPEVADPPST